MRITGGKLKGKALAAGAASGVRPTGVKVRQALFNVLGGAADGAVFLDLYAGSGAVGAEALSRGAAKVVFVDSNRANIEALRALEILRDIRAGAEVRVIECDAAEALKNLAAEGERFDIVFADPPYGSGELDLILPLLGAGDALREGALVVAEHFFKKSPPEKAGALRLKKRYRYGDTVLSLYEINR